MVQNTKVAKYRQVQESTQCDGPRSGEKYGNAKVLVVLFRIPVALVYVRDDGKT